MRGQMLRPKRPFGRKGPPENYVDARQGQEMIFLNDKIWVGAENVLTPQEVIEVAATWVRLARAQGWTLTDQYGRVLDIEQALKTSGLQTYEDGGRDYGDETG